jgi:hypothetical protein
MSDREFSLDMSLEERQKKFLEMTDEEIDYSDIPPLDDNFFQNTRSVQRQPKKSPFRST